MKAEYNKAAADLSMLKAEVVKSLRGESSFSQDLLASLIADSETNCLKVKEQLNTAQPAHDEGQAVMVALNAQYDDIISTLTLNSSASGLTLTLSPHKAKTRFFSETGF